MDLYNNLYSNRPATEGTPVSVRPIEEIGSGDAGPGAYQPFWHGPTNTILGERLPFDDGSGGGSGDANEEFLLAYAGATPGTAAMLGLVAAGGLPAAGSPFGRLAETFARLGDDVVTQWDDLKNIDPDTKKRLISLGWDLTQFGLDIAGIFDPFGVADGANTIISLVRRDWLGASLSATGMLVPYLGDLAKAGKFGKYVTSLNEAIELAGKSKQIRKLMIPIFQGLDEVIDAAKKVPYSQIEEKALAVYELYAKAEPRLRLLFLAMGTTPQAVTKAAYDEMMKHLDDAQRQIGAFLRPTKEELLERLAQRGVKHTPEDIVAIAQDSSGRVVFLELGNAKAGLQHIIDRHAAEFASRGIPEAQIADAVMAAITRGRRVGMQGGRPIFEVTFNGQAHRIAVTVGSNGYIVGANPATR